MSKTGACVWPVGTHAVSVCVCAHARVRVCARVCAHVCPHTYACARARVPCLRGFGFRGCSRASASKDLKEPGLVLVVVASAPVCTRIPHICAQM